MYLADYTISMPEMPSEKQEKARSLDYFQKHLCKKFEFSTVTELNRAISQIERFEKENESIYEKEFAFLNDRYGNQDKIVSQLKYIFKNSEAIA